MKKFLCCLLAATTLFAVASTSVSCGGSGTGGDHSSAETSYEESTVSLRLTKKAYNIENEQTVALQIEFTANGEEANPAVLNFSSSDPTIATVSDDGVVTGVSGGKAYITVSYGAKTAKATINVTMREYRLDLSDESLLMLVGVERQVTANAYYGLTELTDAELLWTTSDPAVATVENGLITAVGNGKAEITVSYEGVSKTVAITSVVEATAEQVNTFDEAYINIYGRSYMELGTLMLDHAANGVEVGIIGTSLKMTMYSQAKGYMRVFVDGGTSSKRIAVEAGTHEYTIASRLEQGLHTVRIVKCTEEQQNAYWDVRSFAAEKFFAVPAKSELKIEFIGDSITAGHGSLGFAGQEHTIDNSDATKAYAYLTAQALDADYSIVAYSGICTEAYYWLNYLNMVTLYNQISYKNKQQYAFDFEADVVVLNLGTNEASYVETVEGSHYGAQFSTDYREFLGTIRDKHPNAYIICLYGMGSKKSVVHLGIQRAIEELSDEKIVYNPFEIRANGDGGNGHPSSAAHKEWAEDLTAYIQTLAL